MSNELGDLIVNFSTKRSAAMELFAVLKSMIYHDVEKFGLPRINFENEYFILICEEKDNPQKMFYHDELKISVPYFDNEEPVWRVDFKVKKGEFSFVDYVRKYVNEFFESNGMGKV